MNTSNFFDDPETPVEFRGLSYGHRPFGQLVVRDIIQSLCEVVDMKRWILLPSLLVAAFSLGPAVDAQTSKIGPPASRRPGGTGSSTLERSGLRIGQQLPDIRVLDEDGKEFPIARLRGKYAVLVFGCLT